ncbi:hypothetical protein ROSEINA2194_00104 [Roseburia inulinivorans DSM 16841]|uniref:Uncharacterized protein n=1 Tax=Roseburia inulinivorans DSM 16841 TaxID=622312 RepID=C0FN09_9FIRM|nr:hypothetical protein ROSEINA2194_00104 [Roseburia inulinivorans DSM 16841]
MYFHIFTFTFLINGLILTKIFSQCNSPQQQKTEQKRTAMFSKL